MNTIRQIERMEKLHGLILREMTGDSLDLSIKLGVSRRMVNYYLRGVPGLWCPDSVLTGSQNLLLFE
ncbi:hypothetical protein NIB75_12785 [Bacteroides uniformis]|nr:hypothetical protein [Bacteroides uniformis]MCO7113156.1 hypothetical protein [Bacteroides uniformis]